MSRPCHVLRVFTRGSDGGNHLGVVNDRTGLGTDAMQAIAADLGFSETVFVDWHPPDPPFVRIFTPMMELQFAGHPLVGTAWVMNVLGPGSHELLRCGTGDVGVRMEGDVVWIEAALDQPVRDASHLSLASRAGLPSSVAAWLVDMPKEYLILQYPDAATVADISPAWGPLSEVFGTLVFARHGDAVRARFFAPDAGVPEDPATGSAAVALAAVLVDAGETAGRVSIDQGEEIGFPSRIELSWTSETASIGGTVIRDEVRILEA